jgi:4-diphosphocytidyl-2-C-methyl-D-erythritol kinase
MATRVRSYSKINLGLAIGPVRADGFHGLATLYQTLALHDIVTVEVGPGSGRQVPGAREVRQSGITLTTNHPGVPTDGRNTAWKMVELALGRMGVAAEVKIHIQKELPVQGGMGAGSANAAAALLGLERELGVALPEAQRLELAAEVGSDVPLFLVGGAVLGTGRGELVEAMPDLPATWCVVAVPEVGVSTPRAFRDWDELCAGKAAAGWAGAKYGGLSTPLRSGRDDASKGERHSGRDDASLGGRGSGRDDASIEGDNSGLDDASKNMRSGRDDASIGAVDRRQTKGIEVAANASLTSLPQPDRLEELSHVYASVFGARASDTSGIVRGSGSSPEKQQARGDTRNDLAGNTLLALVRTGIENDFETVVFPQYPLLREIKRLLMGTTAGVSSDAPADSGGNALYAALSGSGSALFGLYGSESEAREAQRRVQATGCKALLTETLPRQEYWRRMFAE